MKKKSYLKTIEVVLAAIITTIFMLYIMPQFTGSENREKNLLVLKDIKTDDSFRGYVLANEGCTYSNENTAINTVIENYLPYAYDYVVTNFDNTAVSAIVLTIIVIGLMMFITKDDSPKKDDNSKS